MAVHGLVGFIVMSPPTALRLIGAYTFAARLRGCLRRPALGADTGLHLKPCRAIHTFGMVRPIDVVFLDASGTILSAHSVLPPARIAWCRHATQVIELPMGYLSSQADIQATIELALQQPAGTWAELLSDSSRLGRDQAAGG